MDILAVICAALYLYAGWQTYRVIVLTTSSLSAPRDEFDAALANGESIQFITAVFVISWPVWLLAGAVNARFGGGTAS